MREHALLSSRRSTQARCVEGTRALPRQGLSIVVRWSNEVNDVAGTDIPNDASAEPGDVPVAITDDLTGPVLPSARLVCLVGKDRGRSFVVHDTCVIGRSHADVCLSGRDVSRRHARLHCTPQGLFVEDLGSANGTFVNGTAVSGRHPLMPGDRLQLASTILVFAEHDGLEGRLRELQKLDALTAAVSGIAHDFNNAMQTLVVGLDEVEGSPKDRDTLQDMKLAAAAAAGLAKRILTLGRNTARADEQVSLAAVVDESVRMTRHLIAREIQVSCEVDERAYTRGSRDELQQALTNMILNARDALGRTGTITITCERVTLDPTAALALQLPTDAEPSGGREYVELCVHDNGCGMDHETLTRALEPFFTTKSAGRGTGLGLAMVHAIAQQHRGGVRLESRVGVGTTVRVYLPASKPPSASV